ncbi:MAG: NAD+ synthase [Rhodothermales bacterium]|nr:NAD+ synthase [Rhodothermales bacterium]MBO6778759.1 NAD+ synthase [Rhodothermales bacterium]
MKIALAQINPTVGDLIGNAERILTFARRAAEQGADLAVFPELCVTGYPPLDLLENEAFLDRAQETMQRIAADAPPGLGLVLGGPVRNPSPVGKRLQNVAVLFEDGRELGRAVKVLLPTYDVFDEYRYFEPGRTADPIEFRGVRLGLHVCEDMWNNEEQADYHLYAANPIDELAERGVDVFVNISASPFSHGKHARRCEVLEEICQEHGKPFVLVNQVGANTEVLFDGDSRVHHADGSLAACAPSFEESMVIWDSEAPSVPCSMPHDRIADMHDALVMGIRDYVRKTGAFERALIGLSGGIDSAVTAALAVEALGGDAVDGITMPSRFSSGGSVEDSRVLAENLGMRFHEIAIARAVDAFESMLEPLFDGTEFGVAEENIQARSRGVTLMAISNKFGHLLLTTGNKSELSVGYATLYGDMSGGLAVLADVFKMDVYALARYINQRAGRELIPESTITKPPSAELRPDQKDSDSLPEYDVLDAILERYVEGLQDVDRIEAETGFDRALIERILRMVDRNEYKRRQAPPGLRVSAKAFGMGRRLPIVMKPSYRSAPVHD